MRPERGEFAGLLIVVAEVGFFSALVLVELGERHSGPCLLIDHPYLTGAGVSGITALIVAALYRCQRPTTGIPPRDPPPVVVHVTRINLSFNDVFELVFMVLIAQIVIGVGIGIVVLGILLFTGNL